MTAELNTNKILQGDALEELKKIPDNSVDSVITDPPYGLVFMGKSWDNDVPGQDVWRECLRVLKPGGFLLSFGGTRTYHRMVVAIEDAGFEVRDMIEWVYGCLSEDTEILTQNGWEHYHRNSNKYPILIYDVENGIYKWEIPKKWNEYQVKDTCYRIKSNKTDQLVSRNHRVPVEQNGRIVFKFAETLECQENIPFLESFPSMSKTIYNLHKGTSSKKQSMFFKMQELFSTIQEKKTNKIFSENKLSSLWKGISNKKGQTFQILFPKVQWNSERTGMEKTCTQRKKELDKEKRKPIKKKDGGKKQPCLEWGSNLLQKKRQLQECEICPLSKEIYKYGEKGWLCNGTPINNGKTFEQNPFKEGSSPSQRPQSREQQNRELNSIQEQQGTQNSRGYGITKAKVTKEEYSGMIFCPTVSTGCFVARRNGKIFITGNSGFPKSHNIGKAVDKLQGNEREVLGTHIKKAGDMTSGNFKRGGNYPDKELTETKGTSEWEGWGTALKPAHEPICMARKPFKSSVAENCLKWGTGGINIDESRIAISQEDSEKSANNWKPKKGYDTTKTIYKTGIKSLDTKQHSQGRFPANLIHDNSEEVRECFPNESERFFKSIVYNPKAGKKERNAGCEDLEEKQRSNINKMMGEAGSFKTGSGNDRTTKFTNNHQTIKPLKLMEYLIKMVTPKGGMVLDPFIGSGTTAMACVKNGYKYIGIEREPEYVEIARLRIKKIEEELE